jgi:hypothetical protein
MVDGKPILCERDKNPKKLKLQNLHPMLDEETISNIIGDTHGKTRVIIHREENKIDLNKE